MTSGLTPTERALLEDLAAGPRTLAELERRTGTPLVTGILERLEALGLARMAGSHADGPWILTDAGVPEVGALDDRDDPVPPHATCELFSLAPPTSLTTTY